jgi:hypothetical protein
VRVEWAFFATTETGYSVFVTVEVLEQPTWPYLGIVTVVLLMLVVAMVVVYRKRTKKAF